MVATAAAPWHVSLCDWTPRHQNLHCPIVHGGKFGEVCLCPLLHCMPHALSGALKQFCLCPDVLFSHWNGPITPLPLDATMGPAGTGLGDKGQKPCWAQESHHPASPCLFLFLLRPLSTLQTQPKAVLLGQVLSVRLFFLGEFLLPGWEFNKYTYRWSPTYDGSTWRFSILP